jgi:hypothetical protein
VRKQDDQRTTTPNMSMVNKVMHRSKQWRLKLKPTKDYLPIDQSLHLQ